MKLWSLAMGAVVFCCLVVVARAEERLPEPFYLYQDSAPDVRWPYSPSGWMGDWSDLSMDEASFEQPWEGKTCIKIHYSAESTQQMGWAGIFWQRPANNWGDKAAGLDLTGARVLKFLARGAQGGEVIEKFQVGGIRGRYSDSAQVMIGPITLTEQWQEYSIPVQAHDLSSLIGAFAWATSKRVNPNGCVFYLDSIRFE